MSSLHARSSYTWALGCGLKQLVVAAIIQVSVALAVLLALSYLAGRQSVVLFAERNLGLYGSRADGSYRLRG